MLHLPVYSLYNVCHERYSNYVPHPGWVEVGMYDIFSTCTCNDIFTEIMQKEMLITYIEC